MLDKGKQLAAGLLATFTLSGTVKSDDVSEHHAVDALAIEFLRDADFPAGQWVKDDPMRVAVSIRLGGATTYEPQVIKSVIEQDLAKNEITNAVFFWEHGLEDGGTGISIHTDTVVFGPFGLGTVRNEIAEVADQIRFNRKMDLAVLELSSRN